LSLQRSGDLAALSEKIVDFDASIRAVAIVDNQGVVLGQFPGDFKVDEDIKRSFGSVVAAILGMSRHAGRFAGETRLAMTEFDRASTGVIPIPGTDFSVALLCLKSTNLPYLAERIRTYVSQSLRVERVGL
jgi:hypothetical protein